MLYYTSILLDIRFILIHLFLFRLQIYCKKRNKALVYVPKNLFHVPILFQSPQKSIFKTYVIPLAIGDMVIIIVAEQGVSLVTFLHPICPCISLNTSLTIELLVHRQRVIHIIKISHAWQAAIRLSVTAF